MAKILVVEDDESLVVELKEILSQEGHVIDVVNDGRSALESLKNFTYELLIFDVNIPEINGVQLCTKFRADGGITPVLMLTGLSSDSDKETGLDSGADDYLTKPFSSRELQARIRALLRRSPVAPSSALKYRDLVVDTTTKSVKRGEKDIKLWPKEYDVLVYLLKHINHVFDTDALLNRVWPMEAETSPEAIRQCVKRLREKIDVDGEPSIISTVKGFGYTIKDI
ncbi:response regulator transcription factor [Candidatus Obscuribacterales bacterium]|nr:response regulator transcription factor [Candidatus Obscuribacterales bacterium]